MLDIQHHLAGADREVLVVRIPKELTHETAEPLRACIMRQLPNRDGAALILDCAEVTIISSIGIAALLQVQEFCLDRAVPALIAALHPRQEAFLRMLKLEQKFPLLPSVDAALVHLATS